MTLNNNETTQIIHMRYHHCASSSSDRHCTAVFISGPIAGILLKRFGCRLVAVAGSLILFVGLLTSSFITSLPGLYATYGFVGGRTQYMPISGEDPGFLKWGFICIKEWEGGGSLC